MVRNAITERIAAHWRERPCPVCGQPPGDMFGLTIVSTTCLTCESCGEVIESWEMYQDQHGNYFTQNHLRALGRDREMGIEGWAVLPW